MGPGTGVQGRGGRPAPSVAKRASGCETETVLAPSGSGCEVLGSVEVGNEFRAMMSLSTSQPAQPSSPPADHPGLLTIKLYPSLSSSANDHASPPSNQLITVSSSHPFGHKLLVQHYHLPRSSVQSPYDSYLIDLDGFTESHTLHGPITAIELAATNRAALSPCLVFGTASGGLYLTRSDFSRPHSKLRQLHRSPVIGLASCPLDVHPTILISGSSTEFLIWDLDDRHPQPICLKAFGRGNPKFLSNPYSSILVGIQFRQISSTGEFHLFAEFKDGSISFWDLQALLDPESIKPDGNLFLTRYQKSFSALDACCTSFTEDDFHVFTVNPQDGWVQRSETSRKLFQLPGPISRFLCIRCDHQTHKMELLALFRDTHQLMNITIDDSPQLESPSVNYTQLESDCTFFHYDRSDGWLVTGKTKTQEMAVRKIEQSIRIVQSHDVHPQAPLKRRASYGTRNAGFLTLGMIQGTDNSQTRDADLMKLFRDELDQRSKFPDHLRSAIYKRMLIKSKLHEEELATTYYRYLARPCPELFLKRFRSAWKLEDAEFQFSLETLLSIFHGMETYSESSLIDKLAPILYGFLKILESFVEEISRLEDGREESIELLEIYKVSWLMLDRFGEGAFGEKGNSQSDRKKYYEVFVEKVKQRLLDNRSSVGRSLLEHFERHSVSLGKDCLPRLTHGFLMGFSSPESFKSLMDHLVIGHSGLVSLTELSARILEYFGQDILCLSNQKDILNFFGLTHDIDIRAFRNLI
ncbi:hypothetical protein PSTG_00628 [Puccinia striiformis f. sp. tritici PST-78]|uniref:Uncharacterized protein n=1 Tax=Puccinia striiformis f. sp. tritici PST-78 TaxID=1165861 RepID=A0A0L0W3Q1_9BASI|nr:hypothetical protein PSTG_00628 [Puccinia striiformis f. sp. tritici PST-78]